MTDKQRETLAQVENLLTEHFDGFVVVVHAADVGNDCDTEDKCSYNGGIALALGLLDFAKQKLRKRMWSERDEEEDRSARG